MMAIAECLETHGIISAAQAALSDERFYEAEKRLLETEKRWREGSSSVHSYLTCSSEAPDLLWSLTEEYRQIFDKIYQKYGIEGIWY